MASVAEEFLSGGRGGEGVHVHGRRSRGSAHLRLSEYSRRVQDTVWPGEEHGPRICRSPPCNHGDSRWIPNRLGPEEDSAAWKRRVCDGYLLDRAARCQVYVLYSMEC